MAALVRVRVGGFRIGTSGRRATKEEKIRRIELLRWQDVRRRSGERRRGARGVAGGAAVGGLSSSGLVDRRMRRRSSYRW